MVNGTEVSQSSLPTAIFNSSSSSRKHFQRWKFDNQRISQKGQDISKKIVVHVVKEGVTLNSISKLYGVSILENCWLADGNKEIGDVDLVLEGHYLNIPLAIAGYAQVCHFEGTKLREHQSPNATPTLRFPRRQWNQMLTVLSPHRLPLAKTAGSFLVVVPLMAFCIGCIMGAFQNIVSRNSRHQAANKSGVDHHRSNSMRWKSVLGDSRDKDSLDAESQPEFDPLSKDHEQLHFEDTSHASSKLEDDYQKFLSECGISNWGYWRGGSPQ